ncbi:MAG: hypothetical protein PHC75_09650 [Burkholderiales bacterium]|nr:hypothetical protein [Burkholderiales bacterium]
MNQVQLAIILIIVGAIIIIIGNHIYQEHKFKKSIDLGFNNSNNDTIENNSMIFENKEPIQVNNVRDIEDKDMFDIDLNLNEDDSKVENEHVQKAFAHYDSVQFQFDSKINKICQHIIDITFSNTAKIKMFPELSQFTGKAIQYFILEKGNWHTYDRSKKHNADGVKIVLDLVDSEGVIYPLQLSNIYNELAKFADYHKGFIREEDSAQKITYIQEQIKHISSAQLELELFMVNKVDIPFRVLSAYLINKGFIENNYSFQYIIDGKVAFYLLDENGSQFNPSSEYRLFSINSKLHHTKTPKVVIDKIFDFAEDYMQNFEARLLTNNKIVMSDKDYNMLERQIKNYMATCERLKIDLASDIIMKLYP